MENKNTYYIEDGLDEMVSSSDEIAVHTKKRESKFGKKLTFKQILALSLVAVVLFAGFAAAIKIKTLEDQLAAAREEIAEVAQLVPEVQITSVCVRDRIREIGELSTQVYEYDNYRETKNVRTLFGSNITIPGTKQAVTIYYSGTVKMGYNLADVETVVDNTARVITIDLPEAIATENSIHLTRIEGKNNILNPINVEKIVTYLDGYKEEALENALYNGITDQANARMEFIIRNSLSVFPDYTVEFI